ncbi:MAG: alanine racemase [Acidobacteria bacterium]|nr:alanine racemase [Acidobacteriota bacterium]
MRDTGSDFRAAHIDLAALGSNFGVIRDLVSPARVMGVVKADAYGHGVRVVAPALVEAGVDWLGVADLSEALELRTRGISTPVLAWLHGPTTDFVPGIDAGIDIGVSSRDQLERVAAAASGSGRAAAVQLKVDSGLSRNGISPAEREEIFERAASLQAAGSIRVRGIFSHLSNTSPSDDARQKSVFEQALAEALAAGLDPELRHLASTQAAIEKPDYRFDVVRIGIGLYGLPAADSMDAAALGLRPVMQLEAEVAAVRRVPAGTGVSYGYIHRTTRETTLALVPLGYADGVPRGASNRGEVSINGRRCPVVGRIAMDQFLVDVGEGEVAVGDRVVIWGDPADGVPSAEQWATAADTIGYEIVTRVGPRVPRVARS